MREKSKLLILAFLGIILSLSLVYFGFTSQIPKSELRKIIKKPEEPLGIKKYPEVKLTLSPAEATVYFGQTLEIRVLAESQEKLIATDLELIFDPQVLIAKEAKPGIFWSKPQELTKILDNSKGEILYGIATLEPKSGQGIIASFKFTVKELSLTSLTTTISFKSGTQASVVGGEAKAKFSESGKYVILKTNE